MTIMRTTITISMTTNKTDLEGPRRVAQLRRTTQKAVVVETISGETAEMSPGTIQTAMAVGGDFRTGKTSQTSQTSKTGV